MAQLIQGEVFGNRHYGVWLSARWVFRPAQLTQAVAKAPFSADQVSFRVASLHLATQPADVQAHVVCLA